MVNVYYRLVKMGTWTVEQVPALWRQGVQDKLDAEASEE